MPLYPGNQELRIKKIASPARDGYGMESYSSSTHCGTHIDAPYHFHEDGKTVDSASLSTLMGEGYVIRPEFSGEDILEKDLKEVWNEDYDNKIILINTSWDRKRSFNEEFQEHFPGLSLESVDFFDQHHISVIGIDTLGIEPFKNTDFRVHKALLSRERYIIEDLANLDSLVVGEKYYIIALPLKIRKGSGAMARVVAVKE